MADLDQISHMIGRIEANTANIKDWMDEHEERDQERFKQLTERLDLNNGYRFRIEALEDAHELTKPVLENFQRIKWIVMGFILALGVAGGAVGSWAMEIFKVAI